MSSYRQILYHIIFGTKFRRPTIDEINSEALYQYIAAIIRNKNCQVFRISGYHDHVHIFSDLHPSIALATFVKDIKIATSIWMKATGMFPQFEAWAEGYGAFTYCIRDKEMIYNYVKNQKIHHRKESFPNEFERLLCENEVDFDRQFLV